MRRTASIVFKALLVLGTAAGLIMNIKSAPFGVIMSYYTIQSNIVCLGVTLAALILEIMGAPYREGRAYTWIKFSAVICIALTGLVYHTMLAPGIKAATDINYDHGSFMNHMVHTFTPVMMLLDYLIFDLHGKIRFSRIFTALILPLYYLGYVALFTSLGGQYGNTGSAANVPYFFMDYVTLGWGGVVKWTLLLALLVMVMAAVLFALDRLCARIFGKRAKC